MKSEKYLDNKSLSIVLFASVFLLYSIVYMSKNAFSSAMAAIVEEGFMTKSQTGFINAVFWIIYAPFQIVGGIAADKYSPYKLIIIGLVGAMIANIIIFFNQSYPVILAAWSFNAAAQFGLWPGVFKIVSTQTAPDVRKSVVFWMMFSTSVGLGFSMLTASFVKHWQQNFLVSTIILFVTIVSFSVVYSFLERKMVVKESADTEMKKEKVKKAPMMPLMLSSGLSVFLLVTLLRVAVDNGIKMMTPVMLMESYSELPAALATRISSILVIFSALGILIAGFLKSRITENESKAQIILYALSLPALLLVCFLGRLHYIWILAALSLSVSMMHGAASFGQAYIAVRFEKHGRIGTVSGLLNATASMGNILASYIFAKMAELMPWGTVATSWLMIVFVCIILCAVVLTRWSKFIED